ncbi:MAG: glycosyltransferase family 4 protein [Paludibacteraceae bacterium]|nr:glycosyltransferase family 4 protein [Paludibacteraceae bacterium]
MKIVFLIQDITTQGGTERTTICLAQEMVKHGHEVCIMSLFKQNDMPQYPIEEAVTITYATYLNYRLEIGWCKRILYILTALKALKKRSEIEDADCVICQKLLASVVGWMGGWAKKSITCEHYRYKMYTPLIRWWRNRLYNHFRRLVVLTENDRQQFEQQVQRVTVIPNMISIHPLPYEGLNSKTIISIGRLTAQKGFDLLIDAIHQIADEMGDYTLEIYGDGEDKPQLEKQIDECQLGQKVHLHPFTKHIDEVYQNAAFYVMASRFEGFPMTLLEAAASGVPIVSFDCPEGPSVLLKQGGGLLVEKENIHALGEAILKMTDTDLRQTCHRQTQTIILPYLPENIYTRWMQELIDN